MKNLITVSIFAFLLLVSMNSFAQENVKIKKKTFYNYHRSSIPFTKNYGTTFDGHLSGIGLGYNGLISGIGNFSLPQGAKFMSQKGNSFTFEFTPIDFSISLGRKVGFITGLNLEVNNFKFDSDISIKQDENGYIVVDDYGARGITLEKSKLVTTYLTIPVLFEVQFGRRCETFLNFGVIGAWKMQAHTKIKASDDELKGKFKNKKGLNIANFRYGYMAQIGYRDVGIFAKYYPDSIFKNDKGALTKQINIGIILYFRNLY